MVARSVSPGLPVGKWGGLKLLRHHVFFLKLRSSPFQLTARPAQFPILGYFGVGQEEAEGMRGIRKGYRRDAVQTPPPRTLEGLRVTFPAWRCGGACRLRSNLDVP